MVEKKEWEGFSGRLWKEEINVRQFIQDNYTPYDGDESFLAGSTPATDKLWSVLQDCRRKKERKTAFWIWKQKLLPISLHMKLAILMKA